MIGNCKTKFVVSYFSTLFLIFLPVNKVGVFVGSEIKSAINYLNNLTRGYPWYKANITLIEIVKKHSYAYFQTNDFVRFGFLVVENGEWNFTDGRKGFCMD